MNQTTKVIVGNAAGAFSSILKYFSWLEIEDHNPVSVYFHWQNKTNYRGNTLLNYSLARYNENIIINNIFDRFFSLDQKNCDLHKQTFDFNTMYAECYPKNMNFKYPSSLKHDGQGLHISQYKEDISDTRFAFNKQWKKFKLSESLQKKYIQEKFEFNARTLCVMLRCSAHYYGFFDMDSILKDIEFSMEKNQCDKIYVMTQVNPFLQKIINRFGINRCIVPERLRNETDSDWNGGHENIAMTDADFIRETEECIIDVLNASNCNHIIGGASNMLLGALCFNPEVNFTIFNAVSDRNGA